jgi:hypothetical protein
MILKLQYILLFFTLSGGLETSLEPLKSIRYCFRTNYKKPKKTVQEKLASGTRSGSAISKKSAAWYRTSGWGVAQIGCGVAQTRLRRGTLGCGVAQIVERRLAVRQARVRI